MTITQIRYALAIEETMNVSRAAQKLFVSQPALSSQVRKLEQELGYKLFIREAQGVRITKEGHTFCEEARPVLKAWDQLNESVKRTDRDAKKEIRIFLEPRAISNHAVPVINSFFEQHPEYYPSYITDFSMNLEEELRTNQIHAVIGRDPFDSVGSPCSPFVVTELLWETQCAILPHNDPRSRWEAFPLSEFNGCTIISGSPGSYLDNRIHSRFESAGIEPGEYVHCDSFDLYTAMLKSGRGYSMGPTSLREYYGLSVVPLSPPLKLPLCFTYSPKSEEHQIISRLLKYLINEVAKDQQQTMVTREER